MHPDQTGHTWSTIKTTGNKRLQIIDKAIISHKHAHIHIFLKSDLQNFQKSISDFKSEKIWNICVSKLLIWQQKWVIGIRQLTHSLSSVVRQGKCLLFQTKYLVSHQIKPRILKLTISKGQINLSLVFIFVSCEEKGCYSVILIGQLSFDCCLYCEQSHHLQGGVWYISLISLN